MFLLLPVLYLFMNWYMKREKRHRAERGYWVEYVNPYLLTAGPDDFAIVYYENDLWKTFDGRINRTSGANTLTILDEERWQLEMPDWLQSKRAIVIGRIADAYKFVEFVDAS